jgi:hypothetical protein
MSTRQDIASSAPLTARELFLLVLEVDKFPIKGNEDVPVSRDMVRDALEKAKTAVLSPDDPPEFAEWLKALQDPTLTINFPEDTVWALYGHFEPERPW